MKQVVISNDNDGCYTYNIELSHKCLVSELIDEILCNYKKSHGTITIKAKTVNDYKYSEGKLDETLSNSYKFVAKTHRLAYGIKATFL